MRALFSASNLVGIVDFARALHRAGFELLSTGGTGRHLADAGLPVTQVSDVTGFPRYWTAGSRRSTPRYTAASWLAATWPTTVTSSLDTR